jgi:hypothetical protein
MESRRAKAFFVSALTQMRQRNAGRVGPDGKTLKPGSYAVIIFGNYFPAHTINVVGVWPA